MIIWSWKLDNYIPEFKNSNIVDMCSIPGQSLDFHIPLLMGKETEGQGFPGVSAGRNPPTNARDTGSVPGLGRFPWRRKWQPAPVFLPGKFHGHRSLVGYSPWGCKELDTTEWLIHMHTGPSQAMEPKIRALVTSSLIQAPILLLTDCGQVVVV